MVWIKIKHEEEKLIGKVEENLIVGKENRFLGFVCITLNVLWKMTHFP